MKDVILEYIWFGITVLGTIVALSFTMYLFYGEGSNVYQIISTVLGELM